MCRINVDIIGMPVDIYFSYIVAVRFIGGGNGRNRRKPAASY
jgi:hypothetical protein